MTIFCSVVVRTRPLPYVAARLGDDVQRVGRQPAHRRCEPHVVVPVPLLVDAHVVTDRRALAAPGAGPSGSAYPRYSFSSTSRNFSGPQSATRNLILARCRSRR